MLHDLAFMGLGASLAVCATWAACAWGNALTRQDTDRDAAIQARKRKTLADWIERAENAEAAIDVSLNIWGSRWAKPGSECTRNAESAHRALKQLDGWRHGRPYPTEQARKHAAMLKRRVQVTMEETHASRLDEL